MAHADCLVLGASGRIGRLLRLRWGPAAARWQTRAPRPGGGWRVFDPLQDITALQRALQGCRQILCLAGPVPGRGTSSMEVHLEIALAAVRAGADAGARVLLASSAAVYGAGQGRLGEEHPLAPVSDYGQAKAAMESGAAALGRELGVAVTALRIGNIAGFDAILGNWREGFCLDAFPDGGTPRRSYIGPACLADVLAALLAAPELPPVLNIAQPGGVEMGGLLHAAGREFTAVPAPAAAIPEVILDVSRLAGLLGGAPGHPDVLPAADPARMAAEWALLEPDFRKDPI